MVDPIRCWQLLGLILSRGWSEHETKLALAVEVPPTPEGDKWKEANVELINKSMGLLPKCNIDDLQVMSIVCSHTNQALRLPSGNLPPPQGFEYMANSTGTTTAESIIGLSDTMKAPMEHGITWTIIKWQVVDKCPSLLEVLSEADNAKHDTCGKESTIQTLFNIQMRTSLLLDILIGPYLPTRGLTQLFL